MELSCYRPFHVGLLSLEGIRVFSWNGCVLSERGASSGLLTTSSFRSREVQAYRERRYLELGCTCVDERRRFHVELHHEDRAFNPFMSREDSETHNVSVVEITPEAICYRYEERKPGSLELGEPETVCLELG